MNISTKKDTTKDKNINISSLNLWDALFDFIQIEVECSKNYLKIFLPQEAGAFRSNLEKKPQNSGPKLKKVLQLYYIFTDNICCVCNPMEVVIFCKNVLIL